MSLLTRDELNQYIALLDTLPEGSPDVAKVHALLKADKKERCKQNFLPFVREMWSAFIPGKHHQIMADAFERVANGDLKRLIINMPPRHTKSEFASYLFPAWFLGKYPEKKIIQTAHTAELAVGFGRKVRNLVNTPDYQDIFPTKLSSDSKAAGRWNTDKGGDYFAIGVGGAVTGKGADVLIIDDPHSEQEAMLGNPSVYDRVFEWYSSGPRQRLQPGGAIVIVMCMTGDTPVLMADGTTKPLADIRAGDFVATFDNGRLKKSKVNNWQSSGVDFIYKIQTQSGKVLRANERHPFLVMNEGVLEWTRLNQLQVGDQLVSLKDAIDQHEQQPNRENVELAKQGKVTTERIHLPQIDQLAIMESGRAKRAALKVAQKTLQVVGCVASIITKNIFQKNLLKKQESTGLSTDTESLLSSMKKWLKSVMADVMSAVNIQQTKILVLTGTASYASTTAMKQERSVDCFATTATSLSDTEKQQIYLRKLQLISDFTTDSIVSITPDGQEEVFDVEIERTENFIANGFVSHNTRWSKRDLTGQILQSAAKRDLDEWEVIELPALLPSGKPLWKEFWRQEELEAIKSELPVSKWEAQYQQNPTSEEGAIIKRDMWQIWEKDRPPKCDYLIQSWDTAFEKNNRADYSACTTWGIFYLEGEDGYEIANIIVLDAFKERMEFPELKKTAYEMWKDWNPDTCIVEKKAAGSPLIYELRRMGIPISEYTPGKGSDKIARVNAISDLFSSGMVWRPDTRWAEELVEEIASFPNGDHDDLVDSTSQALLRFRQGGFIKLATDEKDRLFVPRRAAYY